MRTSKSVLKPSGAMASIVAKGQQNVADLSETFSDAPVTEVATSYLTENKNNPRRKITEASIAKMVNDIQQCDGQILQPLLIRPIPRNSEGRRYEVICGNRRLRGAQRLDLKTVPVRIWDVDDDTAARFAVWENLGREDLSPVDLAESINDLRSIDGLTWDEVGERFGFSRQWAWQQKKVAELPEEVRDLVREEVLSASNAMLIARDLKTHEEIIEMAHRAVNEKLSFRALEKAIKCKHAFTVEPSNGDEKTSNRKHAFTWSPPPITQKRRYATMIRATKEVVDGFNAGLMTPEYAASLRTFAEDIIKIADGGIEGRTG